MGSVSFWKYICRVRIKKLFGRLEGIVKEIKLVEKEWKQFEQLIARIEQDADNIGVIVTSPDRIPCQFTGRLREVDASIRIPSGVSEKLITIECRKRSRKQDVTWIEQLATKKIAIKAAKTIAVSSSGFSSDAKTIASQHGIELKKLSEISSDQINSLLGINFIVFWRKVSSIAQLTIRPFQSRKWTVPGSEDLLVELTLETDPFKNIFYSRTTNEYWSINDLWLQLQEATDPFADIPKYGPPIIRTACFPYPGTVFVDTPSGTYELGDVLVSFSLSLEPEIVNLDEAKKVEYSSHKESSIQRVEFTSNLDEKKRRVSLQIPKDSDQISDLKVKYENTKE